MRKYFLVVLVLLSVEAVGQKQKYRGKYGLDELSKTPEPPQYHDLNYWVAHPDKIDPSDLTPGKGQLKENQDSAVTDVFFIYPTIYTKKQQRDHPWFADVTDKQLNKKIANSTIKNQASVFNGSAKVYAPLYRQAHINIYYADDLKLKVEALAVAYEDVKQAFQYYLDHWNNGRPIIIASHSQGTDHAVMLLRDFFESYEPLRKKLVAAYIVGMPLDRRTFNNLPPCSNPDDTGCWLTWNTYKRGYYPEKYEWMFNNAFNINPLSWQDNEEYVGFEKNLGGILKNFKKIRPGLSDAQTERGLLWINKPKFFGNFLINWDRYHVVDYNLFYLNIRENVAERVDAYLQKAH